MGGLGGTKINSLTPTLADPGTENLFIRFQETAKAASLFCSLHPWYERGREGSRVGTQKPEIIQQKSPLSRPQDHLTCGFYSWPHNVCVGGGILPFRRQCFPIFPDLTETLQWANIKQGFMKPELIWALKVCETCLGTKGRLWAWEQAKGISFSSHRLSCVFLIDRPRPHLIEMTCSWLEAPRFQVDHLSAEKLSSIYFIKKLDGGLSVCVINILCCGGFILLMVFSPCEVSYPESSFTPTEGFGGNYFT